MYWNIKLKPKDKKILKSEHKKILKSEHTY